MNIGDRVEMTGYITKEESILNKSLPEIERSLGYQQGRLSEGAIVSVAERLPQKGEFEMKGYSTVPGHKHIPLVEREPGVYDKDRLLSMAQNGMASGSGRLVKVTPIKPHDPNVDFDLQYPPGAGVPQWKLTANIPFKVESILEPNGKYTGPSKNSNSQSQVPENTNESLSKKSSANMEDKKESPKKIGEMQSGELKGEFNDAAAKKDVTSKYMKSGGGGNENGSGSSQDQAGKNTATSKFFAENKEGMVNKDGQGESKGKGEESQGKGGSGQGNMGAGTAAAPAPSPGSSAKKETDYKPESQSGDQPQSPSKFHNPNYQHDTPPPKTSPVKENSDDITSKPKGPEDTPTSKPRGYTP